jgi:hypothetical protein
MNLWTRKLGINCLTWYHILLTQPWKSRRSVRSTRVEAIRKWVHTEFCKTWLAWLGKRHWEEGDGVNICLWYVRISNTLPEFINIKQYTAIWDCTSTSLFHTLTLIWAHLRLIYTHHAVPMSRSCRTANGLDCVFPIWFKQWGRVWFTHAMPHPCHATTMPFWNRLLMATAQRGMGMTWHVWITIGRPEKACGRPARVRLLPATTQISMKVFIRSIPVR